MNLQRMSGLLKSPIFWGSAASMAVMAFGWWTFRLPACSLGFDQEIVCTSKWFYLSRATPNEIGDTLAGFAGALAFIWIIATVATQSQELAAQREELELTRREFERMADAQTTQVGLLVKQGEIFENEQKQREEDSYRDLVEQRLVGVWYRMTTMPLSFVSWLIPESCFEDLDFEEFAHLFKLPETDDINRLEKPETPAERDSQLRLQAYHLRELISKLDDCATLLSKDQLPEKPSEFDDLLVEIRSVIELEKFLSEAQRERLRIILLNETLRELQKLSERSELWSSAGARV